MDRLADLMRFIDLMVRQTCRRAYFDHLARSKGPKDERDSIYSIDHLRKVYEKPREHIYQLVKNPQKTLKGVRVENGIPLPKKDSKFTKIEQKILLDFVKKVVESSPKAHLVWVDLQHYLFYAYRNFTSQSPKPTRETLSAVFVCEMRELIIWLRQDDESQLWLRIFTLLREYCIFAQWHFSQNDKEEALRKFFAYYEAILTAAKTIMPVFSDFEKEFIYKNYKVCWIDFNSFIFKRFFYETDRVKYKIDDLLKSKRSPGDTSHMFTLMIKLKKTWCEHDAKVVQIHQERRLIEGTPEAAREKRAHAVHKKLLSATFWVERSKETKKITDMDRLVDQIFDLLKDSQFFPEGPGLNKNGQCICEECLIGKYKYYLDSDDDFSHIATDDRTTFCRKCKIIFNLDQFQRHVNSHTPTITPQDPPCISRIVTEKMDFSKIGGDTSTQQLSDMLNEKLKISNDKVNKITERPAVKSEITKMAYDKFGQNRKDTKSGEKVKNGRIPSLREELMANGFGKALKGDTEKLNSVNITAEKLAETEQMLRDMKKGNHKTQKLSSVSTTDRTAPTNSGRSEVIEPPKKCDCTYCEVFGPQKISEPRDRLRVRLNRRKERRREYNNDIHHRWFYDRADSQSKLENRVPLPHSPPNVMPSVDLTDSITSGKMSNELTGLVNYIEGNVDLSKMDIAHKKAAKKARQREKREKEKLQADMAAVADMKEFVRQEEERKREKREQLKLQADLAALAELKEIVRQEEVRKRELQKEKEELEEQRKLEEAKLKKKLKKQRQAQKRQEVAVEKTAIEETIPAMVTIKRIPGGENGSPSVTITLKGCTPDQDKLLTTLVEMPITQELNQDKKISQETKSKKKKSQLINCPDLIAEVNELSQKPKILAKDVKVTLAVDNSEVAVDFSSPVAIDLMSPDRAKGVKREREPTQDEIMSLGDLKLPPGITITKIEAPISKKSYLCSENDQDSSMFGKSGVIVVDTEKLMSSNKSDTEITSQLSKKKKKKPKRKMQSIEVKDKNHKMVTLRNPIFEQFQSPSPPAIMPPDDETGPASIFKNENGMVTIRSSRLQKSLDNGMVPNGIQYGMTLMPKLSSNMNPKMTDIDIKPIPPMDAQEILSGLPGIEITKIDKKTETFDDTDSCHDAEVSIFPSNGAEFDLEFDKDEDWLYDNIFKPRDVLEDDMDDEELELEAFKRFCQQSVPAKEKTVAHFNVADIVLKKKLT